MVSLQGAFFKADKNEKRIVRHTACVPAEGGGMYPLLRLSAVRVMVRSFRSGAARL